MQHNYRICYIIFVLVCFNATALGNGINVDGKLDEPLWKSARIFSEFKETEPFTLKSSENHTSALVSVNEQGIYIGFRNHQNVIDEHGQISLRDQEIAEDYNEVIIDFDGTGNRGFGFKVSRLNSVQDAIWLDDRRQSTDWDGEWYHAVFTSSDGWNAEIFIPWTSVSMDKSDQDYRYIGIYFSRWIQERQIKVASPAIATSDIQFLKRFVEIEINNYAYQSLDVFPYLSVNRDLVADQSLFNLGLDVFWRPASNQQLSLTLNPDFGQVESDELVVNFSAIESFFEEKRPFFVENHAMFDLRGPENLILVNTRRIGDAPRSESRVSTDIDFAGRYTYFAGEFELGALFASEANISNESGRDFFSGRMGYIQDDYSVGMLVNRTLDDNIDRQADVYALDFSGVLGAHVQFFGLALRSDISMPEIEDESHAYGWTITTEYQHSENWLHQFQILDYDKEMQINDFGFVERVDLKKLTYHSLYEWPFGVPSIGIKDMAYELTSQWQQNQAGISLPWSIYNTFIINTLANEEWELELNYQQEGFDDLLTEGHHKVELPAMSEFKLSYKSDQRLPLIWDMSFATGQSGFSGNRTAYEFEPSYQLSEATAIAIEVTYVEHDSWLISLFEEDDEDEEEDGEESKFTHSVNRSFRLDEHIENLVGEFKQRELSVALNFSTRIAQRHEIKIQVESVAVSAKAKYQYVALEDGVLSIQDDKPESFSESEFLAQIRYRYEISPLSNIYVVYGRGGEFSTDEQNNFSWLMKRAIRRPIEENLFVKVRFHF